jgi:hypothetical protein
MNYMIDEDTYELPQINETNFVKNYLPLLMDKSNPRGRTLWLDNVAKQPFIRVNVVDDHDKSKILYWVPQVAYSVKTKIGSNIGAFTLNSVEASRRMGAPHLLDRAIGSALKQAIELEEPPQEDIDQWKMILERYGFLKSSR